MSIFTTVDSKTKRHEVLRLILSGKEMHTQRDILDALKRNGHVVTQATLSRDLETLRAIKIKCGSGYSYILPDSPLYRHRPKKEVISDYVEKSGFKTINFSGNLAVISTRPGFAAGLAHEIDNAPLPTILGTVAGYDTIIVVLAEEAARADFIEDLSTVIPDVLDAF